MPLHDLSKNILKELHRLQPVDRETITSRFPNEDPEAITKCLQRQALYGYVRTDYRVAHHHRAVIGLARKRIAYLLHTKGKQFLQYSHRQFRESSLVIRKYANEESGTLGHALGVSRFLGLLYNGSDRGLWNFRFLREEKMLPGIKPDLQLTINGFLRLVEFERRNKMSRSVAHALRYLEAFRSKKFDGRVLFLTQYRAHAEAIREQVAKLDAGDLFYFASEEDYDLARPELLLESHLRTANGQNRAFVLPLREPRLAPSPNASDLSGRPQRNGLMTETTQEQSHGSQGKV